MARLKKQYLIFCRYQFDGKHVYDGHFTFPGLLSVWFVVKFLGLGLDNHIQFLHESRVIIKQFPVIIITKIRPIPF